MVDKLQSDNYTQWKGDLIDVTLTAAATLTSVQENVALDSSGGAFPVELPDITEMTTDKEIWFFDLGDAAANNITITANAGDGSSLDDGNEYLVDLNNRTVGFRLINKRWQVIESSLRDTIIGAFDFVDNASVTTISFVNTFTDIEGTGVASSINNGFNFSISPNTLTSTFGASYTGIIRYNATVSRDIGNAPREIAVAVFEDTGGGFVKIGITEVAATMTGDLTNVTGQTFITVVNGNKYKVMIENRDSTDDILVSNLSLGILKIR